MTAANYIEVSFTVAEPGSIQQDLLIAALGEAGYESFLETSVGFNAYIREAHFSESRLQGAIEEVAIPGQECVFAYEFRLIEPENWNQVWERNFSPVVIGNQCRIRASFHEPDPAFGLEIQIDPKMAFGTGHHETTWLMVSWLLELSVAGKKVLDMGCGTGVLAILAAKKGAAEVLAADIDAVCVESTIENAALNRVELVCLQSDVRGLDARDFDVILANINRNVLLDDIPRYAEKLRPGDSTLLISGFYEGEDLDMLRKKAGESGFQFVAARSRNGWAAAQFRK